MLYKLLFIFIFLALIIFAWTFRSQSEVTNLNNKNAGNSPLFTPSAPSINNIFNDNHAWTATLSALRIRTLITTGDVMPARSVNAKILKYKDFKWPYLKTAGVTRDADITFVNLETPLIKNCPITQEGMIFCGNTGNTEGLVYAGVDVANLANNHTSNHGQQGVRETKDLLNKNGILATGINSYVIRDVRGIKFAFLGYNDISAPQPGISNAKEQKIKKEISDAKKQADIVITAFHWGIEYKNQPDNRQKYLGHFAIDAGADLVIGNHPHWIQPIEIYQNKLITYSHGNFVFDQMWSQKTREGIIGKYTFYDNKLIDIEFIPIKIQDFGQPHLIADPAVKKIILDDMKLQSIRLISFPK